MKNSIEKEAAKMILKLCKITKNQVKDKKTLHEITIYEKAAELYLIIDKAKRGVI